MGDEKTNFYKEIEVCLYLFDINQLIVDYLALLSVLGVGTLIHDLPNVPCQKLPEVVTDSRVHDTVLEVNDVNSKVDP